MYSKILIVGRDSKEVTWEEGKRTGDSGKQRGRPVPKHSVIVPRALRLWIPAFASHGTRDFLSATKGTDQSI